MKLCYCILIIIFSMSISTNAQNGFENHYTFNTFSNGEGVLEIPGSGYYIIGWNDSVVVDNNGASISYVEGLIVRINYYGDTIKTYHAGWGDTLYHLLYGYDSNDIFRSGIITDDTNLLITGYTQSYNPQNYYDNDLWILKLDRNLDTIMTSTFSIPDSALATWNTVALKNNQDGIVIGGYQSDFPNGIKQSQITAFDSNGNLKFHQRLLPNSLSWLQGVAQTTDGGYIAVGAYVNIFPNDCSPLVIKVDSQGNYNWHYLLPFSGDYHFAESITKTQDGNFVFTWANAVQNAGAVHKVYLYHATKIDQSGNQIWTKDYTYSNDPAFRVKELPNKNLIMGGLFVDTLGTANCRQALLILCDSLGDTLWTRTFYEFPNPISPLISDFNYTSDGGFILTGNTPCCNFSQNFGWTPSVWVLKVDSLGLITAVNNLPNSDVPSNSLGVVYPNPTSNSCVVSTIISPEIENALLVLYDMNTKQLQEIKIGNGFNQTKIDLS